MARDDKERVDEVADFADWLATGEPYERKVLDDEALAVLEDVEEYVAAPVVDRDFKTAFAGRLLEEAERLERERAVARGDWRLRPRARWALAGLAGAAVLLAVFSFSVVSPFVRGGSGQVASAKEVFQRHSAAIARGASLQPGQVLHQVISYPVPGAPKTEESWQLVGPDGDVARAYTRFYGGPSSAQQWFDGEFLVSKGAGTVSAAPMAAHRPMEGIGLFEDVGQALELGGLPGEVAGAVSANQSLGNGGSLSAQYRVTGSGSVAGRPTIIVEGQGARVEFDKEIYAVLAARIQGTNQAVSTEETLGSDTLPPVAYEVPTFDVAAARAQPPVLTPDAPALPGLPTYVPPGLWADMFGTRGWFDAVTSADLLTVGYDGPETTEVTIERAPGYVGCKAPSATCQATDVNGHPATIRTGRGKNGAVWHWLQWNDSRGGILMSGPLAPEEMLKMARSMPGS